MQVVTVEVTIPRALLSLGLRRDEIQNRLQNWLVISLFTDGRISSGKAGKLLGNKQEGLFGFALSRGRSLL